MAGELPPVVAVLTASSGDFMAKMAEAKATMKDVSDTGSSHFSKLSSVGGMALGAIAASAVAVGGVSLKMASDFQQATTQLVTGAGESRKNIDMVRQGILSMAGEVGQAPMELAKGMFLIESAGYHGAAGLTVLKSAAEGAATGGASMESVANALTTAMHDYNIPTSQANNVTSALIETVASGKTHLEDLSQSLGRVMPTASALGVKFQDVTGAIATMTNAGLSARFASQHLQNTLLALSAPSATATKSLFEVGLSSQQVKDALDGPQGLSGAISLIEDHVNNKFPAGSVASVNALKNIMGGVTGYSTSLMLSGANQATFEQNVKNIGDRLDGSGKSVQGFADVQKDVGFQAKQAEASLEALGIRIGDWLIPKVEDVAHFLEGAAEWLNKNRDAAYALAAVIGGVLAVAIGAFAVNTVAKFVSSVQQAASSLTSWLTNSTSTAGMDAAAAQAEGDAEGMGTSFSGAATTVEEAMAQMAAAVSAAADEIMASLTEVDGAIAATRAEAGSPMSMGGLVSPGGSPLSRVERGAASKAEKTAASGAEDALITGGETAAGVGTAEGVAGGAGALGASVGLSSIIPAAVAGTVAYIGTTEILKHTAAGGVVTSAANSVANAFGVGPEQVTQHHLAADLGPATIAYLQRIAAGVEKTASMTAQQASSMLSQASLGRTTHGGAPIPQGTATTADLAKDASIQKQMSVLEEMKNRVATDAKAGASAAQIHEDQMALRTTAEKWGSEHGISLKAIHDKETASFDKLVTLHEDQSKLITSGAGNLEQSKYIKGVLDNQLKTQESHLADLETAHASKAAIDQAKAEIVTTHTKISGVQSHIDDLKGVASQITKTSDALSQEKSLESVMSKVNQDTSDLKSAIKSGIEVSKLPSQALTATGRISVSVS